ncbi:peptidase M4 [Corallococcus sp. CA049B]|uniref:M4 family metallopeptidase n=1 Tax=Corallococcus sp. CA049B TaxID=2316730 RepID=UPI000EA30AA6|nr:M4 family metallopeptidase [Corallococcus sp. CA049B]NOJ94391.1 peptidase M4 [Corallococcus coralloides]RKG75709.1 peptidase M4 [Corallococcus sp. CA049B]
MTIRRTEGSTPVSLRPTTDTSAPAKAKNVLRVKDGFESVSRTGAAAGAQPTAAAAATSQASTTGAPSAQTGRLALDSKEAQQAIQTSLKHLTPPLTASNLLAANKAGPTLAAKSVERDELGMTHVRLDRMHEGVKVFGEQVISHLGADGKVSSVTGEQNAIPAGLGNQKVKLAPQQAIDIAKKELGGKADKQPSSERVVYQDADGKYRAAYQVEVTQIAGQEKPKKQNYIIDANTGAVLESFNKIGGWSKKAAAPMQVNGTASPNVAIPDKGQVQSKINIPDGVTVDKLSVDLNIKHTWSGDLKVSVTSPSGKTTVLQDRKGGSKDDIAGSFDLTEAFKGESAKGEWTITVEDKAARDTGTLNNWSLNIQAKETTPPPTDPQNPPTGTADDQSMYSGHVDLKTKKEADGTYSLEDSTRGKGVVTYDANNKTTASGQTKITDDNDKWGEATDPARAKAAVDAHYGAAMTYDFMKNIMGRDSIDGAGEKLTSYVHVRNNYVNAFWDGEKMSYGDGDGKQSGPLTTLDIAGHEIAHGLTERTAGLIYSGESGGLNESFSDIIGTGVEWYAAQNNPEAKWNWTVGEAAWTPNNGSDEDGLRYMNDPTKDNYSVDNYKNYPKQTEVHGSSGISNNAFYLLVEGGKNKTSGLEVKGGIGMEDGLKIFTRALTTYMTPRTTFAQAREATIKAATDLHGADSVQVQKVKDAWTAVGVN